MNKLTDDWYSRRILEMIPTLLILVAVFFVGGIASLLVALLMNFVSAVFLPILKPHMIGNPWLFMGGVLAIGFIQLEWMSLVFRLATQVVRMNPQAWPWVLWISFFCLGQTPMYRVTRGEVEMNEINNEEVKRAVVAQQNMIGIVLYAGLIYWVVMCFVPSASIAPLWWMPAYPWLRQ